MSNLNIRITELRNSKHMNQKEFSEFVGCPRSSLSEIESGKRSPNVEFIIEISTKFPDINLNWLLKGEGEMLKGNTQNPIFDMEVIKTAELITELNKDQRQEIFAVISEKKQLNAMKRQLDLMTSSWQSQQCA
jgi:transcriptional regulator with XRE-family HTH domain